MRRALRELRLATGLYVECNLCGWRGPRLNSDSWHPHTLCPGCCSEVRHRLLVAAMTHLDGLQFEQLARGKTVLHFAPEVPLRKILLQHAAKYLAADYLAEGYNYKIDLQVDLSRMPEIESGQIDLLVACDVLEHVPNHLGAMREIHRVLKPGGWAVLTVPQKDHLEKTPDDSSASTPQERLERFGQEDHLRIYGNDFPRLLTQAGFIVKQIDETSFSPRMVKRYVLFPPQFSSRPAATNYRKVFFAQNPSNPWIALVEA